MVLIAASEEMNVFLTPGALFIGDVWGTAAAILSLITNLTATGLIGYKAWYVGAVCSNRSPGGAILASLVIDDLSGDSRDCSRTWSAGALQQHE